MWGTNSIIGRSMVLYEDPDDFGLAGTDYSVLKGSMGCEIACCNIREFFIKEQPGEFEDVETLDPDSRNLRALSVDGEHIDHFTQD